MRGDGRPDSGSTHVLTRLLVACVRLQALVFGLLLLALVMSQVNFLLGKAVEIGTMFFSQELSGRFVRLFNILIYFYFGIVVGRYVSRFLPLHLHELELRRRLTLPAAVGVLAALFVGTLSPWAVGSFYWLLPGIMYYAGLAAVLVAPKRTAERTVLFLRRFSFDRLVFAAVLRAVPRDAKLMGLIPSREPVRSWDPLDTALGGLRILRPIRSAPCLICSTDDEWVRNVKLLIARAHVIVMDLSQVSESILIELGLLRETGVLPRTVVLLPQANERQLADLAAQHGLDLRQTLDIVPYELSWWSNGIKMAAGLLAVAAAGFALVTAGVPWAVSLYLFGNLAFAAGSLLFKPGVDRTARKRLRRAIREFFRAERRRAAASWPARIRVYFLGDKNRNPVVWPFHESRFDRRALTYLLPGLCVMFLANQAWWAYGPFLLIAAWFSLMTFDEESEIKGGILFVLSGLLPYLLHESLGAIR